LKNVPRSLAPSRHAGGFTLIEVMCAVVVLGIGISAILGLIAQATRSVSTARGATVQVALARQAMVEIENLYWQKKADEVETSGDFGPDFPDYRFEVEITEDIDEKVTGLQLVELTVFWDRGSYEREYTLTTYLIDFSK
jgi:prepilin-type N-terminal cleavage/methylation domain-containing protein